MAARIKAHEEGAWVREAAMAYAKKINTHTHTSAAALKTT